MLNATAELSPAMISPPGPPFGFPRCHGRESRSRQVIDHRPVGQCDVVAPAQKWPTGPRWPRRSCSRWWPRSRRCPRSTAPPKASTGPAALERAPVGQGERAVDCQWSGDVQRPAREDHAGCDRLTWCCREGVASGDDDRALKGAAPVKRGPRVHRHRTRIREIGHVEIALLHDNRAGVNERDVDVDADRGRRGERAGIVERHRGTVSSPMLFSPLLAPTVANVAPRHVVDDRPCIKLDIGQRAEVPGGRP